MVFLIGVFAGIGISMVEVIWESGQPEDPLTLFVRSVTNGGFYVNISYYLILIFILPIIAIPQLKKRLPSKAILVYIFASGITFWGAVDGLYILLK